MKILGIYYATACYRDEQGRYYTSNGLGRYLQVMNEEFPQIKVHLLAPTTTEPLAHLQYPLPERVQVYELPYFETFHEAVKVRRQLRQRLRAFVAEKPIDVMWLRYSGAYAPVLWKECVARRIPSFFEIVSEPVSVARNIRGLRGRVAVLVALVHQRQMRQIFASSTPAFGVSQAVIRPFSPFVSTVIEATTLVKEDFLEREDTCTENPVRVLFVGGLRHEKSVDTLIEAVGALQRRGIDVHLHLVGDGDKRSELQQLAQTHLTAGTYYFHGFQTEPSILHQYYATSDILVLCSVSEGLPRVLMEAMARSLPVVATSVGGIPELVRHEVNGLLVPPRRPDALADAIQRIIGDAPLRRRICAQAYRTAQQHTVRAFLSKVLEFIREHCGVDLF